MTAGDRDIPRNRFVHLKGSEWRGRQLPIGNQIKRNFENFKVRQSFDRNYPADGIRSCSRHLTLLATELRHGIAFP